MKQAGNLQNKKILLVSRSPRREHLINGLDIDYKVIYPSETDESFPHDMDPYKVPEFLARKKALNFNQKLDSNTILITADTIVLCKDEIVNKPKDYPDAVRMLKKLSGNRHTVITGVCLKSQKKEIIFSATTDVYFSKLTDEEIEYYLEKYRPYDKAGAYGIQEWIGYIGIEKIEGSFFNVMGLPLHKLYSKLKHF